MFYHWTGQNWLINIPLGQKLNDLLVPKPSAPRWEICFLQSRDPSNLGTHQSWHSQPLQDPTVRVCVCVHTHAHAHMWACRKRPPFLEFSCSSHPKQLIWDVMWQTLERWMQMENSPGTFDPSEGFRKNHITSGKGGLWIFWHFLTRLCYPQTVKGEGVREKRKQMFGTHCFFLFFLFEKCSKPFFLFSWKIFNLLKVDSDSVNSPK